MSPRPDFAYIQARIAARHGARLDDAGWRSLRAHRSLAVYLDRSHGSGLNRWTANLHPHQDPHDMERRLRALWRDYVHEIAGWTAPKWQPAVTSLVMLPDLAIIEHIRRGRPAPAWLIDDPLLAGYAEPEDDILQRAGFASPDGTSASDLPISQLWLTRFETLWPQDERLEFEQMKPPFSAVLKLLAGMTSPMPLDERFSHCERELKGLFRRRAMLASALFAHLALTLIDLMRLRGDLLVRRLFADLPTEGRA